MLYWNTEMKIIIIFFFGDGENNCANLNSQIPQSLQFQFSFHSISKIGYWKSQIFSYKSETIFKASLEL